MKGPIQSHVTNLTEFFQDTKACGYQDRHPDSLKEFTVWCPETGKQPTVLTSVASAMGERWTRADQWDGSLVTGAGCSARRCSLVSTPTWKFTVIYNYRFGGLIPSSSLWGHEAGPFPWIHSLHIASRYFPLVLQSVAHSQAINHSVILLQWWGRYELKRVF